jgi:peptidoglycan/xylan/chitin deacetylase (PgdA/CDA1 family)
LAELLKKYSIKGTFYIAPLNHEVSKSELLNEDQLRLLAKDFEIGAHTMTHVRLAEIDRDSAEKEMRNSKSYLEKVLGKTVSSFSYPYGSFNKSIIDAARNIGFRCARTTQAYRFDCGCSLCMPTSMHAFDQLRDIWPIAKFANFNPIKFIRYYHHWDTLAIAMFDQTLEKGGVFHLWGHSFDIDRFNDWEQLERVLRHISGHESVNYITNGELIK